MTVGLLYIVAAILDAPILNLSFVTIPMLLSKTTLYASWWVSFYSTVFAGSIIFSYYLGVGMDLFSPSKTRYPHLILSGLFLIGRILFLGVLYVKHPLYLFLITFLFFLYRRTAFPYWIELLKHYEPEKWKQYLSRGYVVTSIFSVASSIIIGILFDSTDEYEIYILMPALVTLPFAFFLFYALRKFALKKDRNVLLNPFSSFIKIVNERDGYLSFQLLYIPIGIGMTLLTPLHPLFFRHLGFSYTEASLYMGMAKGIGGAFGYFLAPYIYQQCKSVYKTLMVPLFIIGISIASLGGIIELQTTYDLSIYLLRSTVFIISLMYGIGVAILLFIWTTSSGVFSAGEKSSIPLTRINDLIGGVRGIVIPPLIIPLLSFLTIGQLYAAIGTLFLLTIGLILFSIKKGFVNYPESV